MRSGDPKLKVDDPNPTDVNWSELKRSDIEDWLAETEWSLPRDAHKQPGIFTVEQMGLYLVGRGDPRRDGCRLVIGLFGGLRRLGICALD